jgi:hypothetical protein
VIISVVALYFAFRGVDVEAALMRLQHADPLPLIAILGIIGAQLFLRTVRWRALLAIAHPVRPLRVATLLPILLIGYLGNAVLPARLGELIRAFLAARAERHDSGVVFRHRGA